MTTTIDTTVISRAIHYGTATLHEAMGRRGALPYGIKPIAGSMKLAGAATTVSSPPLDNLMLHQALYVAAPGTVMVVEVNRGYEAGYWGEIMTQAALQRNISGLVIDGCVRDADLIEQAGFPVFSRGLSIRGTDKNGGGHINAPIMIADVTINPGDLIVGDRDGVVVVPAAEIAATLDAAQKREDKETQIKRDLAAGKRTLEIYGWPPATA
ncbi:MAG TPA: 4-carboxy-4-hydroxy-2-oxoadipate aldolase/oxaloacetate decarboxylase [Candidatus Binatia bacterium]